MATSVVIAIIANRTSATIEKMTPGPARRVLRQATSKAIPVRITPIVATVAPRAWSVRQRLAAQDDRQHDRQAAVRRDDAADDGDRADAQAGEVDEVRPGADQPEQRGQRERGRVGRERRARDERDDDQDRGPDELHAGHHPQAADRAGWRAPMRCPSCPRRGRHRVRSAVRWASGSLAGRRPTSCYHSGTGPPSADVARPSRGDVAQLEEHCVRIAGVRGSSPLISTIASRATVLPVYTRPRDRRRCRLRRGHPPPGRGTPARRGRPTGDTRRARPAPHARARL